VPDLENRKPKSITQQAIEQAMMMGQNSATQVPQNEHKISLPAWIAMLGGQGMDLGTTLAALKNPNIHESNPLLGQHPSDTKLILAKGGSTAAMIALMKLLEHAGHEKAADAIGYISGGVGAGAGINNLMQMKKAQ
jgi:hypothetical protein